MTRGFVHQTIWCWLLLIPACTWASPITLVDLTGDDNIHADNRIHVQRLLDPTAQFNARTAAATIRDGKASSNVKFRQPLWSYSTLDNRSGTEHWSLIIRQSFARGERVYLSVDGNKWQALQAAGSDTPPVARFYHFTLPINANAELLVHSTRASLNPIKLSFIPTHNVGQYANHYAGTLLILLGIMLGLCCVNLAWALILRTTTHFLYVCYSLALVSFVFIPYPLIHQTLLMGIGPESLFRPLISLSSLFAFLFCLSFLSAEGKHFVIKPWHKIWAGSLLLILIQSIAFKELNGFTQKPLQITFLGTGLIVVYLVIRSALRGFTPAKLFLPAWIFMLIGQLMGVLFLRWGSGMSVWVGFLPIAFFIAELFTSLAALGMRINHARRERDIIRVEKRAIELENLQREKFVATLSHEVRTPIHAMLGSMELLGQTSLTEEQHRHWQHGKYAGESLYAMVDNLLDHIQVDVQSTNQQHFNPQRLAHSMTEMFSSRASQKGITLLTSADHLPVQLSGNAVVLRRLLINLISNAVKYTDSGVVQLQLSITDDEQSLVAKVQDTGRGIDSHYLATLGTHSAPQSNSLYSFDPSSGLGLPICQDLVTAAGGELHLDSELNVGTTATIKLPVQHISTSTARYELTLLLVDDTDTAQLIDAEILQSHGYHVITATNGQAALTQARQQPIDVVLTDLRMPHMDGAALLVALQAEFPQLPVVVWSANMTQTQVGTLMAQGASACLQKPYDYALLAELLARHAKGDDHSHGAAALPSALIPSEPNTSTHALSAQRRTELLPIYHQQMQQDQQLFLTAQAQNQTEEMADIAHRIASANFAMGQHDIANIARQLESSLRAGEDTQALSQQLWEACDKDDQRNC